MEYLLLIFRKWPETETYWLINRPGLPVSPASPLLANTPSEPLLIPDLLACLTETLTSDMAVYTGYQFMNTWTTTTTTTTTTNGSDSSSTDHFVLLARQNHTSTNSPQSQPQTQTQNKDKGEAQAQAQADAENNNNSPKHSHSHHRIPSSVSRDMSRIKGHLSQALEICGSDLCALLAETDA